MAFKLDIDYEKIRKKLQEQKALVAKEKEVGKMLGLDSNQLFSYMKEHNIDSGEKVHSLYDQLSKSTPSAPSVQATPSTPTASIQPQIQQPAPYSSPYQAEVDALLQQILNPKAFYYDAESDPLYQTYKKRYQQAGEESFQNTLGDLAGMTGGRLNTWATSAASQARQAWDDRLMDTVPELYNLAYSMHLGDLQEKYNQLGALRDLEAADYSRYRDSIGDYRYQQEWDYGVGRDRISDARYQDETAYQRAMEQLQRQYNMGRDAIADQRYQQEWDYGVERDKVADERYQQQWDYGVSQDEYNRMSKEEQTAYDRAWQEKMWDYGVSQDQYNRMTAEEQRAYDREMEQKKWNYGVSRDNVADQRYQQEWEYRMQQDALKQQGGEPPTARELSNYNQIVQGLIRNNSSPAEALDFVNRIGKQQYVDLIGDDLYNQLLSDLQGGFKEGEKDAIPALYVEMMKSPNPQEWFDENATWLSPAEFDALKKYIPSYEDMLNKEYFYDYLNKKKK